MPKIDINNKKTGGALGTEPQNIAYSENYVTYNYGQFKRLMGNRDLSEQQITKIAASMQVKQLKIPIVVNENYEVIDGQHRLEACKRNGFPVYFCIVDGLTIDDCVTANINAKNWRTVDVIKRYAKTGDDNCGRIIEVMEKCDASLDMVMAAAKKGVIAGQKKISKLMENRIVFTEDDKETAIDYLNKAGQIASIIGKDKGGNEKLRRAIIRCCKTPGYDHERMVVACRNNALNYKDGTSIVDILTELAGFYNKGLRRKKAFMDVYGRDASLKVVFDAEVNHF